MRKRRYRVNGLLGRGGFGSVYKAEKLGEEGFSTLVAIKLLHAMGGGDPRLDKARNDAVRRLRDEARLLGLLEHRAIVRVYDLERLRGEWAIVMEYVDGIQLGELVELCRVPVRQALAIVEEVADALHTAYHFEPSGQKLRLLHRDIKPSNIMISRGGSIKVLDFGIARADFAARESHTQGFLVGTQRTMSPEALDFDDDLIPVGPASDIYSLGAVLFELLAHEPFGRATLDPLLHQDKVAAKLDEHILGRVPRGLYDLLKRMLSFAPAERPSAFELRTACEDLQRALPGESLRAWCERVVAPVLRRREPLPPGRDPLIGTVIEEGELPEGAFLDAHDSTVSASRPPSPRGLGDSWADDPAPAPAPAVAQAQPSASTRGAGAIDLGGERDDLAAPVGFDAPIHQTQDDMPRAGVAIAIDDDGGWEPRAPRHRSPPADDGTGSRRPIFFGVGLGLLVVVAAGFWALSMVLDSLEAGPELLEDPPAAVVDQEGAPPGPAGESVTAEPEPEPEPEPAAAPAPRPVSAAPAPAPVAAAPAAAPEPRPAPAPVAVAPAPAPAPVPPVEPVTPSEPEPSSTVDARLAAIAALRGGGATEQAPASASSDEAPAVVPTEPEPIAASVQSAPEEPPPPPAPGSFRVQGNAIEVFLKSGGKRFEPGAQLDAGRYDIWALFDRSPGAAPIRVGVARIEAGVTSTIDCDASMTLCRAI